MKLQINVPVSGLDLASLLQNEEGFFLCQNRGQNFITVAKAGHSIAFGPTPIGRGIIEQPSATLGPVNTEEPLVSFHSDAADNLRAITGLLEAVAAEAGVSDLAPLKAEIEAMDEKIDKLVYELYELTAEEMKVVKGAK